MPVFRSVAVGVMCGLIALVSDAQANDEFEINVLNHTFSGAGDLLDNLRDSINNCDADLLDQITHDYWVGIGLPFTEDLTKPRTIRNFRDECEDGHTFNYEIHLNNVWYYDDGYVILFALRGNRIDREGNETPSNLHISIFVNVDDDGEHLIMHHHASESPG